MAESPAHPSRPATFRSVFLRAGVVLGVFALVNVTSGLVLDAARDRCGARENGCVNNARRANAEVIILGSSRGKHHYDDALLTRLWGVKVFNAGYDGQGVPFSRVMFDLIAREHAPKLVILDVVVFGDDFDRAHALDPWYFESPVLRGLPAPGETPKPGAYGENWRTSAAMRLPLYRYSGKTKHTLQDARIAYSDTGYAAIAPKEHAPFGPRTKVKPPVHSWFPGELEALSRQCAAMGAGLALVVSPRQSDFDSDPAYAPARDFAAKRGVPFFAYAPEARPEFDSEKLFVDISHLNAEGARLFTEDVARTLRPLITDLSKPPAPTATPIPVR